MFMQMLLGSMWEDAWWIRETMDRRGIAKEANAQEGKVEEAVRHPQDGPWKQGP